MREAIAVKSYLRQSSVLIQCVERDRLYLLRKEVVAETDLVNPFVVLESINYAEQARISKSTRAEIKLFQLCCASTSTCDHFGEHLNHLVTQEILVAHQGLNVSGGNYIAQDLEATWTDLVKTHVELLQLWCALQRLSQKGHSLIANNVSFDIKGLKR